METSTRPTNAMIIADVMHKTKEFRTNHVTLEGGKVWSNNQHVQVRIVGSKQLTWLRIQERNANTNEIRITLVTKGETMTTTILTKKNGIRATIKAYKHLINQGLIQQQD